MRNRSWPKITVLLCEIILTRRTILNILKAIFTIQDAVKIQELKVTESYTKEIGPNIKKQSKRKNPQRENDENPQKSEVTDVTPLT